MAIPFAPTLPQGGYNKTVSPPVTPAAPAGGVDMNALLAAFAQLTQSNAALGPQRLQQQNDALFGRHLGTGGAQVTSSNPTGNASNPWDDKGLFHGGFASQLPQQAIQMSQGNSAVNQWKMPNLFHGVGVAPDPNDHAMGAVAASPSTQVVPPRPIPPPLTGPMGSPESDLANLHQNMGMFSPGGIQPSSRARAAAPRTTSARRGSVLGAGMFGGNGSPRPGFGF